MRYWVYDKIDELIKQKDISRRKLAMLAGINISTMSALFARRPVPLPDKYLSPIAEALGVDKAVFDNETLEAEFESKAGENAARVTESQYLYENSLFRQLGNKAQREERARRIRYPNENVLSIMSQIIALDDEDIDALESWLAALQVHRIYSKQRRNK